MNGRKVRATTRHFLKSMDNGLLIGETRKCEMCQTPFTLHPRGMNKRFCSYKCKRRGLYQRNSVHYLKSRKAWIAKNKEKHLKYRMDYNERRRNERGMQKIKLDIASAIWIANELRYEIGMQITLEKRTLKVMNKEDNKGGRHPTTCIHGISPKRNCVPCMSNLNKMNRHKNIEQFREKQREYYSRKYKPISDKNRAITAFRQFMKFVEVRMHVREVRKCEGCSTLFYINPKVITKRFCSRRCKEKIKYSRNPKKHIAAQYRWNAKNIDRLREYKRNYYKQKRIEINEIKDIKLKIAEASWIAEKLRYQIGMQILPKGKMEMLNEIWS